MLYLFLKSISILNERLFFKLIAKIYVNEYQKVTGVEAEKAFRGREQKFQKSI